MDSLSINSQNSAAGGSGEATSDDMRAELQQRAKAREELSNPNKDVASFSTKPDDAKPVANQFAKAKFGLAPNKDNTNKKSGLSDGEKKGLLAGGIAAGILGIGIALTHGKTADDASRALRHTVEENTDDTIHTAGRGRGRRRRGGGGGSIPNPTGTGDSLASRFGDRISNGRAAVRSRFVNARVHDAFREIGVDNKPTVQAIYAHLESKYGTMTRRQLEDILNRGGHTIDLDTIPHFQGAIADDSIVHRLENFLQDRANVTPQQFGKKARYTPTERASVPVRPAPAPLTQANVDTINRAFEDLGITAPNVVNDLCHHLVANNGITRGAYERMMTGHGIDLNNCLAYHFNFSSLPMDENIAPHLEGFIQRATGDVSPDQFRMFARNRAHGSIPQAPQTPHTQPPIHTPLDAGEISDLTNTFRGLGLTDDTMCQELYTHLQTHSAITKADYEALLLRHNVRAGDYPLYTTRCGTLAQDANIAPELEACIEGRTGITANRFQHFVRGQQGLPVPQAPIPQVLHQPPHIPGGPPPPQATPSLADIQAQRLRQTAPYTPARTSREEYSDMRNVFHALGVTDNHPNAIENHLRTVCTHLQEHGTLTRQEYERMLTDGGHAITNEHNAVFENLGPNDDIVHTLEEHLAEYTRNNARREIHPARLREIMQYEPGIPSAVRNCNRLSTADRRYAAENISRLPQDLQDRLLVRNELDNLSDGNLGILCTEHAPLDALIRAARGEEPLGRTDRFRQRLSSLRPGRSRTVGGAAQTPLPAEIRSAPYPRLTDENRQVIANNINNINSRFQQSILSRLEAGRFSTAEIRLLTNPQANAEQLELLARYQPTNWPLSIRAQFSARRNPEIYLDPILRGRVPQHDPLHRVLINLNQSDDDNARELANALARAIAERQPGDVTREFCRQLETEFRIQGHRLNADSLSVIPEADMNNMVTNAHQIYGALEYATWSQIRPNNSDFRQLIRTTTQDPLVSPDEKELFNATINAIGRRDPYRYISLQDYERARDNIITHRPDATASDINTLRGRDLTRVIGH